MLTSPRRKALRPALTAAVAISIGLTAAACGGATREPPADAEEPAASAPADAEDGGADSAATESDDTSASSAGDAGAAGEETEVEIGETIDDPDMGDTVEVLSAVRDFPSEEQADLIADGGEVVLLEVSVAPGEGYGGLVSMGNFAISWDDGADFWGNKTRMVEEELDEAGYEVLEDVSRRDGGEHTGWMAFFVDERADSYLVNYERSGAEVIGSDEVIDPFEQQFEIPAS